MLRAAMRLEIGADLAASPSTPYPGGVGRGGLSCLFQVRTYRAEDEATHAPSCPSLPWRRFQWSEAAAARGSKSASPLARASTPWPHRSQPGPPQGCTSSAPGRGQLSHRARREGLRSSTEVRLRSQAWIARKAGTSPVVRSPALTSGFHPTPSAPQGGLRTPCFASAAPGRSAPAS